MTSTSRLPRLRAVIALLAAAALAGCASGGRARGSTDAIAALESSRAARPTSAPVARALGIAYYQAGRLDDAHRVLGEAARLDSTDGTTALYLGMTAERRGQ